MASSIARQCGQGVYIHSGPEQSVASTKAFTNMVAALSMFAIQIARSRSLSSEIGEMLIQELLEVPKKIETYLASQGPIHSAVELIDKAKSVLFLGRGILSPSSKRRGTQTYGNRLHSMFGVSCGRNEAWTDRIT